jgi:hypothetical protein
MAVSVGIATLPASVPIMVTGKAMSGTGKFLLDLLHGSDVGRAR